MSATRARFVVAALVVAGCVAAPFVATAPAARSTPVLTVAVGEGGAVRSAEGDIDCPTHCKAAYRPDAIVRLNAVPSRYFAFKGWLGDCVGVAPVCEIAPDAVTSVGAAFTRLPGGASIVVGGPGAIISLPEGIACGAGSDIFRTTPSCSGRFPQGTQILLAPKPQPGAVLKAWGGECAGAPLNGCLLTVQPDSLVTATFGAIAPAAGPQTLTVDGAVTSTPAGIACPPDCSASFPGGTVVRLDQSVGPSGWRGACEGAVQACTLVVDGPTEVSSQLLGEGSPPNLGIGLTVTVSGAGRVIAGSDIRCGLTGTLLDCEHAYPFGQTVVLTAVPGRHARLARWGGFCKGRGRTCSVHVTVTKTVRATFRKR